MRPLFIPFVAAGLVLTIVGNHRFDEHSRATYRVEKVQRGTLLSTVSASGTLKPETTAFVSAETAGQVRDVLCEVNQEVHAGEILAHLDPDFAQARLDNAQAELDAARQAIEVSHHQLERARDAVQNAQAMRASADADAKHAVVTAADAARDLARKRKLAATRDVAPVDAEHAEAIADSANAGADSARARASAALGTARAAEEDTRVAQGQLDNAEATVAVRQAALHQAQLDLDRTFLRSPIDGVVLERHAVVGQTVAVGAAVTPLFVIADDLRRLQLHASVAEADIGRLTRGQPASFVFDAFPAETFSGAVTEIAPQPEAPQGVVLYDVVIAADNATRTLLPGMTADVHITIARRDDALQVPTAALHFNPTSAQARAEPGSDAEHVWRLDPNGQPRLIHVHTGISDGIFTEIQSADVTLTNGDNVVVGVTQSNSDSARVGPLRF